MPGLNASTYRWVPNWLDSCCRKIVSAWLWIERARHRRVEHDHVGAEAAAGRDGRPGGRRGGCRGRGRGRWRGGAAAEDLELPERVAVAGGRWGAVHPDVPAGAGDGQRLGAAGRRGGRVDRRSRCSRWPRPGSGTPWRRPVSQFSTTWVIDCGGAEVDLQPLRVGEGDDQRVPVLPSTASEAGKAPAVSVEEAVAGLPCESRVSAALAPTMVIAAYPATTAATRPPIAPRRQGERLRGGAELTGMVIASPWAGNCKGDCLHPRGS